MPLAMLGRQAENLADILRNVPGTDLVRVYGAPDEQILVEVNPQKMADLGIAIPEISRALRAADVKIPAGELNSDRRDYLVEVEGELDTITRVGRVPLFLSLIHI